jgi:glycosyl transferase family 1
VRLAFVSAPGGSVFMEELLAAVADAALRAGGDAICHHGHVADVADERTVCVVVPHEYFVLTGRHDPALLARTIGFGVEHPGTATFATARSFAGSLAATVEIGEDAVREMRRHGVAAQRFVLGCSPIWDRRVPGQARDVDVTHLGTADESRLALLAGIVPGLAGYRTELVLAPHEPMTASGPDFLAGARKWALLARSRLLLNLHREGATAFEWVRALEAISNGCVVLTAPSTGLVPLVPGEHVLVGDPTRMGLVARAALDEPDRLDGIAAAAREVCDTELDMVASAGRLLDLAASIAATAPVCPPRATSRPARTAEKAMAQWVPCERALPDPSTPAQPELARLLREVARLRAVRPGRHVARHTAGRHAVDVVCVAAPGDGPLASTLGSLAAANVFVAAVGGEAVSDAGRLCGLIEYSEWMARGPVRNELLTLGAAPYVLIVDAGDELLNDDALAQLVAALETDSTAQAAYPMAVLGSRMIVNALGVDARRLARFAYLTRGYLVRRSWLEGLGGFGVEPELDGFEDHDFWQRTTALRGQVRLLRRVGLRLWDRAGRLTLADADPAAVRAVLAERASLRMRPAGTAARR